MPINIDYYPCQGLIKDSSAYLFFKPTYPLNSWVQEFWQLNIPDGKYFYRSVPDNCVDIIINLTDPEETFIVTPFSSRKTFEMEGPVSYFGIRFQTLGHQGVISTPIGFWNNNENIIDAKDILTKRMLSVLSTGSYKPMPFQSRCKYFSTILLGVLQDYEIDPRLLRYIAYCHQNIGSSINLSDKQCSEFGLSARHLRRLTSQYLGLSPREFAKVLRFQQTLRIMQKEKYSSDWGRRYYDQSHFIRDFKKMSGVTPNEFQNLSVLYNTD